MSTLQYLINIYLCSGSASTVSLMLSLVKEKKNYLLKFVCLPLTDKGQKYVVKNISFTDKNEDGSVYIKLVN